MKLSQIFLVTFLLQNISIESKQLVDLVKINPTIKVIKLSTWLNKEPQSEIETVYRTNPKMALSLNNVQKDLEKIGLGLKIHRIMPMDPCTLISPPMIDTINRNCYAFVTLINLKTQKELPMPSPVGSHFSKNDRTHKQSWTPEESKNYI